MRLLLPLLLPFVLLTEASAQKFLELGRGSRRSAILAVPIAQQLSAWAGISAPWVPSAPSLSQPELQASTEKSSLATSRIHIRDKVHRPLGARLSKIARRRSQHISQKDAALTQLGDAARYAIGAPGSVFDGNPGYGILPRREGPHGQLDPRPTPPLKNAWIRQWPQISGRRPLWGLLGRTQALAPIELPGNPRSAKGVEAALLQYIRTHPKQFAEISPDSLTLVFTKKVTGREGLTDMVYVGFQQRLNGLPVEGTYANFTVGLMGEKTLILNSSTHLYPKISLRAARTLSHERILQGAFARIGQAPRVSELTQLERRILYLGGQWRVTKLFFDRKKRILIAVDIHTGKAFAWDPHLRLKTSHDALTAQGHVHGRGVLFDPAKTGKNLHKLPLGHIEIRTSQGRKFYADADGRFTVKGTGPNPVKLTMTLRGKYAIVKNQAGPDLEITTLARPGDKLQAVFNPKGHAEFDVAVVNAYFHTTRTYEFLKSRGVYHQGIDKPLRVHVNEDDECNAYYDYVALFFFKSSEDCRNSAYDTVITHENGHRWHLTLLRGASALLRALSIAGLSEGWGDILAMFITRQPVVGEGFFQNKRIKNYIRHGENKYQYHHGDEAHEEGQAWMGFAWKLRKALVSKLGESRGAALAEALVLPVLYALPMDIPTAIQQVLVRSLDKNGHLRYFQEIQTAAQAHGIALKT